MDVPQDVRLIVQGALGSFLMHQDKMKLSDFDSDLSHVSQEIFWMKRFLQENRTVNRMYVYGQKKNMVLYLDGEYTMGVIVSKEANIHLLHRVVNKILSTLKNSLKEVPKKDEPLDEAKTFFDNL